LFNVFGSFVTKIHEINRRYANPKIQPGRSVKLALLMLRIYLLLIVLLLIIKFVITVKGG
jgi:hypothetical protein